MIRTKRGFILNEIIQIFFHIDSHGPGGFLRHCATAPAPKEFSEPEPGYALEPGKDGAFADLEREFFEKHGNRKSGFLLLDNNRESLLQRLMLIDEARYSLDIKYYLWYGDDSGELIFKRAMDAAKRGVRVRLMVDARDLVQKGVKIRVITNSLASQDVPAVNSHYGPWRKPLLEAGIELYELRPDAAIKSQADTPPVVSGFIGLHSKASVVDRSRVYIGSFNLDPRARDFNTEMGALIDSPELAEEVAQLAQELMRPQNSWQVSSMMRASSYGSQVMISGPDNRPRIPGSGLWIYSLNCFPANTFKIYEFEILGIT